MWVCECLWKANVEWRNRKERVWNRNETAKIEQDDRMNVNGDSSTNSDRHRQTTQLGNVLLFFGFVRGTLWSAWGCESVCVLHARTFTGIFDCKTESFYTGVILAFDCGSNVKHYNWNERRKSQLKGRKGRRITKVFCSISSENMRQLYDQCSREFDVWTINCHATVFQSQQSISGLIFFHFIPVSNFIQERHFTNTTL